MPDDAVKVALDAATEAVMAEMGWKDDGAQDFEPVETAGQIAAAAITNFLRALHARGLEGANHPQGQGAGWNGTMIINGETLAAAVARAGGGA